LKNIKYDVNLMTSSNCVI